jgi:hypothetical protein
MTGEMAQLTTAVRYDLTADVATVELAGAIDLPTAAQVRATLTTCLAQCPVALIVEARRLTFLEPVTVTSALLVTSGPGTGQRPETELILCVDPATRPSEFSSPRSVIFVDSPAEALAVATTTRRALPRQSEVLAPAADSPRRAREVVADACGDWGITEVLSPATLIASELVTNAVEHARSESTLELVRRGSYLHIRVSDSSGGEPRLRPPATMPSDALRGRGLMFVDLYSSAWGWLPTPMGKVVWATIPTGPPAELTSSAASR